MTLQSLLEGMMLEVHITGWASTADDKSALTVAQVEAHQTERGDIPKAKSSLPMVELYTQFGSQVMSMWCVLLPECAVVSVHFHGCRHQLLSIENW